MSRYLDIKISGGTKIFLVVGGGGGGANSQSRCGNLFWGAKTAFWTPGVGAGPLCPPRTATENINS